ncbi:glutamate [NMDA] receptor subunit 1 isoform X1 [Halyomorpha halys]|uniref:glutamate [NMDA] receptor subunit 1 isoform X1 n=1 Tax=Halyomorpha halys TaxID=286706 RepID=UPI0034D177FA
MAKRINEDNKHLNHSDAQIHRLFNYVMPDMRCYQVNLTVETDGTAFGQSFQEDLHQSNAVPTLVTGGSWSVVEGCKGFVIIATFFSSVIPIVQKMPRWAEHRILVILKGTGANTLLVPIMVDMRIFRDAEVAIVSSSDLTFGYRLTWTERYYVSFRSEPNATWKRLKEGPNDFLGREIWVQTSSCSMFSQIGPINAKGQPAWTGGAEMIMFQDIAERLKLRPRFNYTKFLHAGWFKEPLTSENKSDVAFCGILVSSRTLELKNIKVSQPLALLCLKLLVPRPQRVSDQWDEIFEPFSPGLWLLIATVTFFTTFLLQRFTTVTRRLVFTKRIKKYELLGESFLQIVAILVLSDVPRSGKEQGAIRHILTWWSIFTLVITTSFSSGLISHLTNKDYTKKIETIEDMIENDFHWAMKTRPEFGDLIDLKDSNQVRWKYRFIQVNSTEEHINLINKGKQVLWGYEVYGGFSLPDYDLPYYILKKFEVSSYCFMEYFTGFAFRRGSPYELAINRYIRWYDEGGLISAVVKKVHTDRYLKNPYVFNVLRQTKSRPGEAERLHLSHLTGIFIVWGIGTAASLLVFLLEIAQKCRI